VGDFRMAKISYEAKINSKSLDGFFKAEPVIDVVDKDA
jgi:hypothetical protein